MASRPSQPQSPLIILGMHRSGTSLTTGLLQGAGLRIGEELMAANQNNQAGHFENMEFYRFHQAALRSQGVDEHGWTLQEIIPVVEPYITEAKALVDRNAITPNWGWKDPRTVLFLDFWANLLPSSSFLMVYRSPWEVIDSLYRRGDPIFQKQPELAVKIWCHYNRKLLNFHKRFPDRCLLVSLATITTAFPKVIRAINKRFHLTLDKNAEPALYQPNWLQHTALDSYQPSQIYHYFPEAIDLYETLENEAWFPKQVTPDRAWRKCAISKLHQFAAFDNWRLLRTLEKRNQTLTAQLQTATSDRRSATAALEAVKQQLQQVQGDLHQTQAALQQQTTAFTEIEQQLQQSQTELAETRSQAQQRQTQLEQVDLASQQQKAQLEAVQTEFAALQTHSHQLQTALEASQVKLSATEVQREQCSTELEQVRSQLEQSQAERQQMQLQIAAAEARHQLLQTELTQVQSQLEDSQTDREKTQTESQQTQLLLDDTKTELAQSYNQLQETETTLRQFRTRWHQTLEDLQVSQAQLHQTEALLQQFQTQNQETECLLTQFQTEYQAAYEKLEQAEQQLDAVTTELAQTQSQLRQKNSDLEQSQIQFLQERERYQQLELNAHHIQEEIKQYQQRLQIAENLRDQTQAELAQYRYQAARSSFQSSLAEDATHPKELQHQLLVWEAWYAYQNGKMDQMVDYLKQSLRYASVARSEMIFEWIKLFTRLSQESRQEFEVEHLIKTQEWQGLINQLTAKRKLATISFSSNF